MPTGLPARHTVARLLAPLAGIALAAALAAALASPAFAAGPGVTLRAVQADDGSWQLSATASDAAGKPAGGQDVRFAVRVEFLGAMRNVEIGAATTDTSGQATLRYVPTRDGDQVLTASLATGDGAAAAPLTIHVAGSTPAIPEQPPTLAGVAAIVFPIAAFVVVAVWVLLLGTFLYAVLGVARPRLRPAWPRPQLEPRRAEHDLGES